MQIYKKKWRNYLVHVFKFSLIIVGFSFVLFGCYKKQDTLLQVYVLDNSGAAVKGANVKVYAEPTDTAIHNPVSINISMLTNESGTALFNMNELYQAGQTGVAIVKVRASYFNKTDESIIQLMEEVNNECSIQLE
jgi:hypothetical protein